MSEAAALASAKLVGRGDEKAADQAAVDAMRTQLNMLDIKGRVVIGEGERDEAPMLFIGEEVGNGTGPEVDIALDPLEGTTLTAKDFPNALTVIAMAPRGAMLHAPDVYMDKLAIGPGFAPDTVTLDMSPSDRVRALAKAKGCDASDITVCVLERPRHEDMIADIRATGAAIRLIMDGDVAAIIHCAEAEMTGIDMYMGSGGAPEGVLAAAALKCMGGQIYGPAAVSQRRRARAPAAPGSGTRQGLHRDEMVTGDVIFRRHRGDGRVDAERDPDRTRLGDDRNPADPIQDRIAAADDLPLALVKRAQGALPPPSPVRAAPPEYLRQDEDGRRADPDRLSDGVRKPRLGRAQQHPMPKRGPRAVARVARSWRSDCPCPPSEHDGGQPAQRHGSDWKTRARPAGRRGAVREIREFRLYRHRAEAWLRPGVTRWWSPG